MRDELILDAAWSAALERHIRELAAEAARTADREARLELIDEAFAAVMRRHEITRGH